MRDDYVRQHYVPQHHIEQFASEESGKVWCFDKVENKTFQVSSSNVAVEKYFYDGPTEPPETEKWLSNLEGEVGGDDGPYQTIIKEKEINTDILAPDDIYYFAFYLAVQEIRTRMWRDKIEDSVRQLQEFLGDDMSEKWEKQFREFREEGSLREFQTDFLKDSVTEWADMLIERMKWQVLENKTDTEIWTSDNPVVRYNSRANVEGSRGGHGLLSVGIEVYFPLTPNLMLHLLDKEAYTEEIQLMKKEVFDPEVLKFFKDIQVQRCSRHIFSNTKDFSLAKKRLREDPEVGDPERDLSSVNKDIHDSYRKWDDSYY